MAREKGQYADGLSKRSVVVPFIVEAGFGGITPHSIAYIAKLAARAKMGKDKTHYGLSRTSTTSFFIHHVQRISLAAIDGDAWQIRRSITEMKMKMNMGKPLTASPP